MAGNLGLGAGSIWNFRPVNRYDYFAVFIFYGANSLGVFILRRRMPDAHRPYKVWGNPVVPAVFILFCIGLFINTIATRPREAAIGMILILLGIPVYFFLKRKHSKEGTK